MRAYWITFSLFDNFLGALVVRATGPDAALARATELGLNPGGKADILTCEDGDIAQFPEGTLLSAADCERGGLVRTDYAPPALLEVLLARHRMQGWKVVEQ